MRNCMKNCSWETFFAGMFSLFCKLSGIWDELGISVSGMEHFVRSSRSVAQRLVISCLISRTWDFSSFTSGWISFVLSCCKGFGIGYFWKSFVRVGISISSFMTFFSSSRIKSLSLRRHSFFVSSLEIFPIRSIRNSFLFLFVRTLIVLIGEYHTLIHLPQSFDSNQCLCHYQMSFVLRQLEASSEVQADK